jgi:plastocyanin
VTAGRPAVLVGCRAGALALALVLVVAGGSGCVGPSRAAGTSPPPLQVITEPGSTTGPYHVTAIDYHFHDAHPTPPLDPHRTIVVTNDGSNVHNVSIPGTPFSKDVKPGHSIALHDIGALFGGPGTHVFICKYHVNLGMRGTVIISPP